MAYLLSLIAQWISLLQSRGIVAPVPNGSRYSYNNVSQASKLIFRWDRSREVRFLLRQL